MYFHKINLFIYVNVNYYIHIHFLCLHKPNIKTALFVGFYFLYFCFHALFLTLYSPIYLIFQLLFLFSFSRYFPITWLSNIFFETFSIFMELGYTPISLCTLRNSSIIFAIQMMIFPFSFVFFLERYIFKIKFSRHYLLNKLNLLITRIERVQISMEINRNILMFQECLKFINYYSTKNT